MGGLREVVTLQTDLYTAVWCYLDKVKRAAWLARHYLWVRTSFSWTGSCRRSNAPP